MVITAAAQQRMIATFEVFLETLKVRLHQTSASMKSQSWDNACNTALIGTNGVAPEWIATPFWSNFFFLPPTSEGSGR